LPAFPPVVSILRRSVDILGDTGVSAREAAPELLLASSDARVSAKGEERPGV